MRGVAQGLVTGMSTATEGNPRLIDHRFLTVRVHELERAAHEVGSIFHRFDDGFTHSDLTPLVVVAFGPFERLVCQAYTVTEAKSK